MMATAPMRRRYPTQRGGRRPTAYRPRPKTYGKASKPLPLTADHFLFADAAVTLRRSVMPRLQRPLQASKPSRSTLDPDDSPLSDDELDSLTASDRPDPLVQSKSVTKRVSSHLDINTRAIDKASDPDRCHTTPSSNQDSHQRAVGSSHTSSLPKITGSFSHVSLRQVKSDLERANIRKLTPTRSPGCLFRPKFSSLQTATACRTRQGSPPHSIPAWTSERVGDGFESLERGVPHHSASRPLRTSHKPVTPGLSKLQLSTGPLPEVEFKRSTIDNDLRESVESTLLRRSDSKESSEILQPYPERDQERSRDELIWRCIIPTFDHRDIARLSAISAPKRTYSSSSCSDLQSSSSEIEHSSRNPQELEDAVSISSEDDELSHSDDSLSIVEDVADIGTPVSCQTGSYL